MPTDTDGSPRSSPVKGTILTSPLKRASQQVSHDSSSLMQDDERGLITLRVREDVIQEEEEPTDIEEYELAPEQTFLTEGPHDDLDAVYEEEEGYEDLHVETNDQYSEQDDLDETFDRSAASDVSSLDQPDTDEEYDTDLEMDVADAEKWIHPEKFDKDTTGIAAYERACEIYGVQPVTYFIKHLQDQELVMKYHGIGANGVRAMSEPLEMNTSIERIDFEGNFILGDGAKVLSRVLKDNVYVSKLILSENKIGNKGAKAICDLLVENKHIVYLDLAGNEIEDSSGQAFYDMLSKNSTLKVLLLRHNCLEDESARWFREALVENDTLETLDISWNHFQKKGCCFIAEGLKSNTGLRHLNLSMNGFGLEGARALEELMKENHTIIDLDVSHCRIPLEGAPHIASGIECNDTLEKINIGYNCIRSEGGYVILCGVEVNETNVLKYVDFGNLTVKTDFKKLADELEEEREMTILYGGVLLDHSRFKREFDDPVSRLMHDPMTKLRHWLDQQNYRLVDLLLTFDRDNNLTIARDELHRGIEMNGIDLTPAEVDQLMDSLDKDGDGEIDMKELMKGDQENTLLERDAKKYQEQQAALAREFKERRMSKTAASYMDILADADVTKLKQVI
ncbi:hypothetical protein CHS0354_027490 [Potamilus streckersoni]|nr:hypothetical protein CHS0354_027490 [Potamilus streckersoni]